MANEFKPSWDKLPKLRDSIPLFNCYVAPCVASCPLQQNIPDMVSLVAEGKYPEALAAILENNAIANITCSACAADCQLFCARNAWEGPVRIKELEKTAVEKGLEGFLSELEPEEPAEQKAAVVGCGIAGLASAYYLSRAGFDTCVFCSQESEEAVAVEIARTVGCPASAALRDIQIAQSHGAVFAFGCKDLSYKTIKAKGPDFIFFDDPVSLEGAENDKDIFVLGSADDGSSCSIVAAEAKDAADNAVKRVLDLLAAQDDDDEEECCDCGCGHDHHEGCDCGCGHDHHEGCSCGHEHNHGEGCCCGHHHEEEEDDSEYRAAEDAFFEDIRKKAAETSEMADVSDPAFAKKEARRCMDCNYLCNRCVEACPNGANIAVDMRCSEFTDDPFQIVHVDHLCRNCGKCAQVCSHRGNPSDAKFTYFSSAEAFEKSANSGFMCFGDEVTIRIMGKTTVCTIDREGEIHGDCDPLAKDLVRQVFLFHGGIFDTGE